MNAATATRPGRTDQFLALGTPADGLMTANEVMAHAGLTGWNVRKTPIIARENGRYLGTVPGQYAVVYDNPADDHRPTPFGTTVGNVWHPVQNEAHVEFLDNIADASGANFYAAGTAKNKSMVYVTMKLPNGLLVGGADRHDLYLTGINSHGDGSFKVMLTPIRFFCTNMIQWKMAAQTVAFKHTTHVNRSIEGARRALDITFAGLSEFEAAADRMVNTTLSDAAFEAIIRTEYGPAADAAKATVTRRTAMIDTIMALWADGMPNANIRNTNWAAYNTLVEFEDHFSGARGADDTKAATRAERSLLGAGGMNFKSHAFDLFNVPDTAAALTVAVPA